MIDVFLCEICKKDLAHKVGDGHLCASCEEAFARLIIATEMTGCKTKAPAAAQKSALPQNTAHECEGRNRIAKAAAATPSNMCAEGDDYLRCCGEMV